MAELLYETWENDVRVRTYYDVGSHEVTVERHQDVQSVIDMVDAVNAEGAPSVDGLGHAVFEVPVVLAMDWAEKRGIPWGKLLYSNDYDSEFKRFAQEYSRLAYRAPKTVHAVS